MEYSMAFCVQIVCICVFVCVPKMYRNMTLWKECYRCGQHRTFFECQGYSLPVSPFTTVTIQLCGPRPKSAFKHLQGSWNFVKFAVTF